MKNRKSIKKILSYISFLSIIIGMGMLATEGTQEPERLASSVGGTVTNI